METLTNDDKNNYNVQHMEIRDIYVEHDFSMEYDDMNGDFTTEESFDPAHMIISMKNTPRASQDSMTRNNRLVTAVPETKIELGPVVDDAEELLLSLSEACAPLSELLHNLSYYVKMTLDETPEEPPDGLTIDESASIRLYTIE
ncbi:unnamed protein product [Rotaria sp. Silwood1]|nr:unnamed protein product [Rotaria sp. Silwood1]CAF3980354.1 unnamed protein product [Rotaria sp. Silwood1]CAF5023306.1 unnamed protein product [Rotaria sp. Silwood1]CAF5130725.1 unnamed protein product [Rotaria sp. Silwood1]